MAHTTCTWMDTSGQGETQLHRSLDKPLDYESDYFHVVFLDLIGLGLEDHILKFIPNVGEYPAYNNHSSPPGILCFLKSLKCMFASANHQNKKKKIFL